MTPPVMTNFVPVLMTKFGEGPTLVMWKNFLNATPTKS